MSKTPQPGTSSLLLNKLGANLIRDLQSILCLCAILEMMFAERYLRNLTETGWPLEKRPLR